LFQMSPFRLLLQRNQPLKVVIYKLRGGIIRKKLLIASVMVRDI
jgi:hypothetical protein